MTDVVIVSATRTAIGATGAAITTKLLAEMDRSDLELGLVTLCIGGGQGIAMLLERG
jgi:acetyl-CoA C-acetyltransferase